MVGFEQHRGHGEGVVEVGQRGRFVALLELGARVEHSLRGGFDGGFGFVRGAAEFRLGGQVWPGVVVLDDAG